MRQESRYSVPAGPFVAILVAFAVIMLVPGIPAGARTVLAVAFLALTSLLAAAAMGLAALRSPDTLKRARTLLAAGLTLAVVGGVIAAITRPEVGSSSFPAIADVIFLAALPFMVGGLICYPFAKSTVGSRVHALLDGAVAATGIWVILYTLILLPATPASGVPSLAELAVVTYPAAATFALGVVVSMVLRVDHRQRRELLTIACGLGVLWLHEIARAVLIAQGSTAAEGWLAIVAEVGYLCLLVAGLVAWRQTQAAATDTNAVGVLATEDDPRETGKSWNRWLPLLPVVTVGGALLVGLVTAAQGESLTAVGFDSAALLILLLLAEQLLSNRELGSLNADLRKNSELFESLVTGSSDLITLHDDGGTLRYASPAVFRMLDLPPHDVLGRSLKEFVHPDDLPKLESAHRELMRRPGATAQLDLRVGPPVGPATTDAPGRRGPWRWVEAVAHNMLADPNVAGVVVNTRDIHEQQILRQRLSYEAYHDPLTGLGNLALARRIFAEHCFGPGREPVTMILADLDGFKTINDTFGHAFGDDVLIAVARRIRRSVDDEDQIARIGGDEFVFILDAGHDAQAAAEQIIEAIRRPFLVQGNTVNVAASLGIARSVDAEDSVELLRNADLAMYAAKSAGGSTAVWYDAAMHEETAYRLRIQDGLRRALEDSAFELHYQPIVELPSGQVIGAEALLRWEDTKLGRMFPDVFIPIAEGSGISAEIDEWVIREACQQLRTWWNTGVNVGQISVNVSRRQLGPSFAEVVRRALEEFGVPARGLCIEVTESAVVGDAEQARQALMEIRRLGVCVALDDFGTGESSLSQLSTLPVDRVKIDKSFVMPSSVDDDALRLLESIVGVCRTIGMPIVAEGVEDQAAVANLTAMGVDFAQGYHFYRPLPASEIPGVVSSPVPSPRLSKDDEVSGAADDEVGKVIYRKFG